MRLDEMVMAFAIFSIGVVALAFASFLFKAIWVLQ